MKGVMISTAIGLLLAIGCAADTADELSTSKPTALTDESTDQTPTPDRGTDADKPEPVPYIPAGRPGSADDYAELVNRLEQIVPDELRSQVPWPDLRTPNPIDAQTAIFDLWIWMAANLPEPELVEIMSAPGSPSRENVVSVFGDIERAGVLEIRSGQPYRAFDHVVVTFESAGLPLWLARGVPDDAVVVYYRDSSGPVTIIDRLTGAIVDIQQGAATRTWLSIMVPTDVGWQLWRDQLIEPTNAELEMPDVPPPPGADIDQRAPEV